MFPMAAPGSGMATIIAQDDPIAQHDEILKLVKKNYMVRTYADFNQNGVSGWECIMDTGTGAMSGGCMMDTPLSYAILV